MAIYSLTVIYMFITLLCLNNSWTAFFSTQSSSLTPLNIKEKKRAADGTDGSKAGDQAEYSIPVHNIACEGFQKYGLGLIVTMAGNQAAVRVS